MTSNPSRLGGTADLEVGLIQYTYSRCQSDSCTMSTTTNAAVEALPNTGSLSFHPKFPQTQPSASAVGLDGNIEMKDRTVTTKTAAPSTASVSNTNAHRVRANIQFISLCYSLFLAGWNDGTTGPLLPRIQEVYHVRPVTF